MPLGLQPVDNAGLGAGEADGGQFRGDGHDHQIDVDVIFVDEGNTRLPAFLLEPALDLAGALFLSARAPAADQHATLLDDVEIAALEGASCHHVVDRNAEALICADRRVIFAPAPPIGHGGNDGAIGRHDAGIARIDLHRQLRLGLMPMHPHAEMLVCCHQLLVLGLGRLDVARTLAQMFAGERAGRQVAQERGRAQKHIAQGIRLVAEAPTLHRLGTAGRVAPLERKWLAGFDAFLQGHGSSPALRCSKPNRESGRT